MKSEVSFEQGYALRGFAMLVIYLVHAMNEYPVYNSAISKAILLPCWAECAVGIFFLMSGYGLSISMDKHKLDLNIYWLLKRLVKLLMVFVVAFLLTIPVLELTKVTYTIKNLLFLNMPEGTDMWFFKVIVANYILLYVLTKLGLRNKTRLLVMTLIQFLGMVVLRHYEFGTHWYISNLCFPLGMALVIWQDKVAKILRHLISIEVVLFLVFVLCNLCRIFWFHNMINGTIANFSGSLFFVFLFTKISSYPKWLTFIGRTSLAFYLLGSPVVWGISSKGLHWSVYFLATTICTALIAYLYERIITIKIRK